MKKFVKIYGRQHHRSDLDTLVEGNTVEGLREEIEGQVSPLDSLLVAAHSHCLFFTMLSLCPHCLFLTVPQTPPSHSRMIHSSLQ